MEITQQIFKVHLGNSDIEWVAFTLQICMNSEHGLSQGDSRGEHRMSLHWWRPRNNKDAVLWSRGSAQSSPCWLLLLRTAVARLHSLSSPGTGSQSTVPSWNVSSLWEGVLFSALGPLLFTTQTTQPVTALRKVPQMKSVTHLSDLALFFWERFYSL